MDVVQPITCSLGPSARLLTLDVGDTPGSSARNSEQRFMCPFSLPDIGYIQRNNLRVIVGVRTVREGPTFTYSLHEPKTLDLSGLKARTAAERT